MTALVPSRSSYVFSRPLRQDSGEAEAPFCFFGQVASSPMDRWRMPRRRENKPSVAPLASRGRPAGMAVPPTVPIRPARTATLPQMHRAPPGRTPTSEASLPPPRLQRASRPERGSGMPAFGISISLDGGVQYFGREYTPPTPEEQDAELSEGYRQKLRAYEHAHSLTVSSSVGVVQFLASSYRSMTEEEVKEAGTHLSQPRVAGYGGRPAVRCFTLIKKMETATPKRLYGYAVSLKRAVDEFSGQGSRDATMRAKAVTLRETVEDCGRNELFFRSQIIWSNEWDRVRDRLLAIEKKVERKKGMNDFIKKLKELCDARSFRGLKEERERFIEYVKAQFEHE